MSSPYSLTPKRHIRKAHALFLTSQVVLSDLPGHEVGVEIKVQIIMCSVLLTVSHFSYIKATTRFVNGTRYTYRAGSASTARAVALAGAGVAVAVPLVS